MYTGFTVYINKYIIILGLNILQWTLMITCNQNYSSEDNDYLR